MRFCNYPYLHRTLDGDTPKRRLVYAAWFYSISPLIMEKLTEDKHIRALDGLRALAILLVLMAHFTPTHDSNKGIRSLFFKVADMGWSGVDLFFVLSGFLITGILLKGKAEGKPIRHYLVRRVLRILPAYYAALILVFLLIPLASNAYSAPSLFIQAPYWLYLSNMFPASYESLAGMFNMSHFWSLALEMQFYALLPIVIYRLSTEPALKICALALAFSLLCRVVAVSLDAHWTITFGWLPMRLDGLVVGSMIALAIHKGITYARMRTILLVVLCGSLGILAMVAWNDMAGALYKGRDYSLSWLVLRVTLPTIVVLFYGAVLWLSLQSNRFTRFLSCRHFAPMARYSYGTYIIHYLVEPVFLKWFGPNNLKPWTGGEDLPIYLYFVLASSMSFVLAMMCYHLIEKRFLLLKSRF